jgi:hypothetical protein
MGERIFAPLIIGITGKRELNGKHDEVRAALRAAFAQLDRSYPHTPKILLTALADGADMIAAEEALRLMETPRNPGAQGCTWQVVARLPLCLDLYLQDFDAAGQQRLRDLCAKIPTQELPPLRRLQPDHPPEPGTPFDRAELVRANGNPNRTDHYEQVGLFIAGKCGLLIAVMDRDEQPAGIGKRSLDSRAPPEAAGTGGGRMRFRHICDTYDVDRHSPVRQPQCRASAPMCKGRRCAKSPPKRGASAMRPNRLLAMTAAALCLASCSSVLPLGDQTATRTASDDPACQASAAQPGTPPCPPPKEPPPGGCGACDRMGQ